MLRDMAPDEAQSLVEERRRVKRERQEKMELVCAIDNDFLVSSRAACSIIMSRVV